MDFVIPIHLYGPSFWGIPAFGHGFSQIIFLDPAFMAFQLFGHICEFQHSGQNYGSWWPETNAGHDMHLKRGSIRNPRKNSER